MAWTSLSTGPTPKPAADGRIVGRSAARPYFRRIRALSLCPAKIGDPQGLLQGDDARGTEDDDTRPLDFGGLPQTVRLTVARMGHLEDPPAAASRGESPGFLRPGKGGNGGLRKSGSLIPAMNRCREAKDDGEKREAKLNRQITDHPRPAIQIPARGLAVHRHPRHVHWWAP